MNKVILIGRLTREPNITQSQTGTTLARYTLAVDRPYSRDEERKADFISCVCFGKTADFAMQYLHQGTKIAVEGRIQTGNYTNREGQKVYTTDVIVNSHEFCESKKSQQKEAEQQKQANKADADDFMDIPDDIDEDIPFA